MCIERKRGGNEHDGAANRHAIDADLRLAASAIALGSAGRVVVTTNVRRLAQFVDARRWQDVPV